jgi:thiamine-phosphate pyrophosphorylase
MANSRLVQCRLYGFIDTTYVDDLDPGEVARNLIAGGVDILQVRAKERTHAERVETGLKVVSAAFTSGVPVIIDDDVEAAFECGADGVHLGQLDWAAIPREGRVERLANMRIVGISTHSLEEALTAERDGADYIGIGPIFPTPTKPGAKGIGTDVIRQVAAQVKIPFFAIGGITLGNIGQVLEAGATRVAVVSAILKARDVTGACAKFKDRLGEAP